MKFLKSIVLARHSVHSLPAMTISSGIIYGQDRNNVACTFQYADLEFLGEVQNSQSDRISSCHCELE